MARKRSPESEAEYRALRDHLIHLGDFCSQGEAVDAIGHSHEMGNYWRKMLPELLAEYRGPLSGLRMAANDMLEVTRHLSRQAVADADEYLRQHGAVTLSERRRIAWSHQIPRILARGKLRTFEEYFLLRESVLAADAGELDDAARAKAERLIAEFENPQGGSGPGATRQ